MVSAVSAVRRLLPRLARTLVRTLDAAVAGATGRARSALEPLFPVTGTLGGSRTQLRKMIFLFCAINAPCMFTWTPYYPSKNT